MYNTELIGVHWVSCNGTVKMDGGGGLKMFLYSFPHGSARFPNVGTRAVDVGALVFVDDAYLVGCRVLVFRIAQCCPEGVSALEMYLDTSEFAKSFELLCCFVDVWYYYGCLVVGFVGRVAGVIGRPGWLWGLVELVFPLVKCPRGEMAAVEGCFYVGKFLVHALLG